MKAELTTERVKAASDLLTLLDRSRIRVTAYFWYYFPESDRWRLVVASPEVRVHGPQAAYRKIQSVMRKLPKAWVHFPPGDVTAVKDTDPLVKLLHAAIGTGRGEVGIRLTNSSINGTFVDDAYIYRMTKPPG